MIIMISCLLCGLWLSCSIVSASGVTGESSPDTDMRSFKPEMGRSDSVISPGESRRITNLPCLSASAPLGWLRCESESPWNGGLTTVMSDQHKSNFRRVALYYQNCYNAVFLRGTLSVTDLLLRLGPECSATCLPTLSLQQTAKQKEAPAKELTIDWHLYWGL